MKLAAVYNVWSDSSDLLRGSIERIKPHVDLIVIVYQTTSNYGVYDDTCIHDINQINDTHVVKIKYEPRERNGMMNEIKKRNIGVDEAKRQRCSHFILLDCDEYYNPDEFNAVKQDIKNKGLKSTYCDFWTFFLKPNLRLKKDAGHIVPFICSMDSLPLGGRFGGVYVDYTRRVEIAPVRVNITMLHLSWIRKDIWSKLNNSSARDNILKVRATIEDDIKNAEHNMFSKYYNTHLEWCEPII